MIFKPAALFLTCALALAACSKEPEPAPPKEELPLTKAAVDKVVPYTCEGDMPVTALFGLDALGNPDLSLIIKGVDFRLSPTEAPNGKRFASPQGPAANVGIIWWEQDDGTVLLQQAPSAQVMDPTAGKTARTCEIKREPGEKAQTK